MAMSASRENDCSGVDYVAFFSANGSLLSRVLMYKAWFLECVALGIYLVKTADKTTKVIVR